MASAIDILRTHYDPRGSIFSLSDNHSDSQKPNFGTNPWLDVANLLSDARGVTKLPFDPNTFAPTVLNCFPRFGDQQSLGRLTVFLGTLWRAEVPGLNTSLDDGDDTYYHQLRRPVGLHFGTDPSFTIDGFKSEGHAVPTTPKLYGALVEQEGTPISSLYEDADEESLSPQCSKQTPLQPAFSTSFPSIPHLNSTPTTATVITPTALSPGPSSGFLHPHRPQPTHPPSPEPSQPTDSPPPRKKRRISTKTRSKLLTEAQRRRNHIISEQQRRAKINGLLAEIRELTPGLLMQYCSKGEAIRRFAEYMRRVEEGNRVLRDYVMKLEGCGVEWVGSECWGIEMGMDGGAVGTAGWDGRWGDWAGEIGIREDGGG